MSTESEILEQLAAWVDEEIVDEVELSINPHEGYRSGITTWRVEIVIDGMPEFFAGDTQLEALTAARDYVLHVQNGLPTIANRSANHEQQ